MTPPYMNADSIVTLARQGQNPPTWQVFRARPAFFRNQIFLGAVVVVIVVAAAIYLLANPLVAFVPGYGSGSETLDPGPFMTARTIDFVVIAIFALAGIGYAVYSVRGLALAQDQVLVLMPDGFVLSTRSAVAYPFATMRDLSASSYRGAITFTVTDAATKQRRRVRLDGRFGNARQLAGRILAQRVEYRAAQVRARPPAPGQR